MKAAVVLLIAAIGAGNAVAPSQTTITIRGRITDSATHKPLVSATVDVREASTITGTDGEGRYSIVDLRPGSYVVTFTLAGFTNFRREGILRSYLERRGRREDCIIFSLLPGELEDGDRG